MAAFVSSLKYQALLPGAVLLMALAPAASLGIYMRSNVKSLVKFGHKSAPATRLVQGANEVRFSKEQLDLMLLNMMDPEFAGLADTVSLQTYRQDPQIGIFWKMQAMESRKARKESELLVAKNNAELACLWRRFGTYDCVASESRKALACAEFERQKALTIARKIARTGRYRDSQSMGLMRQIWNLLNSSSCQAETGAEAVHYLISGKACPGDASVTCGVKRQGLSGVIR